jgi:hypothetical protein
VLRQRDVLPQSVDQCVDSNKLLLTRRTSKEVDFKAGFLIRRHAPKHIPISLIGPARTPSRSSYAAPNHHRHPIS